MANHTTGAQRRNARMDKMFDRYKSEERGLVGDSGIKLKTKLANKMPKKETKAAYLKRHHNDLLKHETN